MPAAMYRTVLLFLLSVNVCTGTTTSSKTKEVTQTSKATANPITLSAMTKDDVTSLAAKVTNNTIKPVTPTNQSATTPAVVPGNVPTSPPPTASTQTPNSTIATQKTSFPPLKATTTNTPNQTETTGSTVTMASTSLLVTPATTHNSTNTTDPGEWNKGDLAANPGLVAIMCIFFIVLVLGLVVAMVKCFDPPRSNFERLEDVPMGKVNEESPFAHYSK